MAFKHAIVLTGSIATGKSTVSKIFASFGFSIIDADKIAHQILNAQGEVVAKMFGDTLFHQGVVDRKALGTIVFSDTQKRKSLEALLHPLIYDEIEKQSTHNDDLKKPYLIDIPLFFENKRYPIEKSLVVYTSAQKQLSRLIKRDGYTKEEAQRRIATQIPIEEKSKWASYVIDNSGTLTQLKQECARVKEEILNDCN